MESKDLVESQNLLKSVKRSINKKLTNITNLQEQIENEEQELHAYMTAKEVMLKVIEAKKIEQKGLDLTRSKE